METTTALAFTAYMVPVNLLDNILKPFIMGRGLKTPMLVTLIGVLGGTIAYGISRIVSGPDCARGHLGVVEHMDGRARICLAVRVPHKLNNGLSA